MSLAWVVWAVVASAVVSGGLPDQVLSRTVSTKYGKIQGFIRHHAKYPLPPVEVFLGVPYASPPLGDGRFTPTSSPLPWDGVRRCTELPAACPQPLPEARNDEDSPTRAAQLASLRRLLQHQSEDCLYLNIYSPHDGGGQFPVMVYIHGEDFMRGSGNLYDGSVLAAYGQVTVVTMNYRLGPLGFLNTRPNASGPGVVGNQGLMDQLAALSWVNENIAHFRGDPRRVTIFGHASGAACINYLIVSPVVVPALFQRAILMSGSALSAWAEVQDPLSVTARLAKLLNCSLPSSLSDRHPETIICLRNVSANRLATLDLPQYKFTSLFGPSVDNVVVTQDFKTRMSRVLEKRGLSVMFGVTEADGYPQLNPEQVQQGLDVSARNRLFRTYVRNVYHHHLQEIYLAITKEYTDWGNPAQHPYVVRNLAVEAISDGSYLAPLMDFGEMVSSQAPTYMYVYSHASHHHEKDKKPFGSLFASEIPLLFGAPFMDDPGHFTDNFSKPDLHVSELLMRYWTNFAKSGDPNLPTDTKPTFSYKDRSFRQKNVSWEQYETIYERFLDINYRPRLKDHYRAHKVALWNWLIPELEEAGAKYPDSDAEAWHSSENPKHFIGPVRPLDPFRFLHTTPATVTTEAPALPTPSDEYLPPNVSAAHGSAPRPVNRSSEAVTGAPGGQFLDYTTALTLTVAIGLSLLVLNAILFAALIYKRDRNSLGPKIKYDSASAQPLCTVDSGIRSVSTHEALSSPVKEGKQACGVDLQCTELHTFPTPPDIGDRNTEVTFHTSNSMHSILSQPTSQFIPPPPLLATTPPTPPVSAQISDGIEGGACSGGRCYPDAGNGQYPDINPNGQFPPDVGQYPSDITSSHFPEQYRGNGGGGGGGGSGGGGQCADPSISVYPTTSASQCTQYCHHYPPSVSQYSSSTDQYSISGSQFSSPGAPCSTSACQFSEAGVSCLPKPAYSDEGGQPEVVVASSGRERVSRSATLQRGASIRKPQPPPRGSTLPSYATLPRQSSKESLSHINA